MAFISIRYIVAVGWDKRVNLFAVSCQGIVVHRLHVSMLFFALMSAFSKDTGESLSQMQRPIEAWISATVSL